MNCRENTRLLSEAMDRKLMAAEREAVERHLAICPACTRCQRQFLEIRRALRRMAGTLPTTFDR